MTTPLPHEPYINAVIDALTTAGLEPDLAWTSDNETDRYGDGESTMLDAVLKWDEDTHPDGLLLIWDHPAENWQWAESRTDGGNTVPEFLPNLGRWSHPDAVVNTVRALLAGQPEPDGHAPYWHLADPVRVAVDAWAAS